MGIAAVAVLGENSDDGEVVAEDADAALGGRARARDGGGIARAFTDRSKHVEFDCGAEGVRALKRE